MANRFFLHLGLFLLYLAPTHAIPGPRDVVPAVPGPTDNFWPLSAQKRSGSLVARQTADTNVSEDPLQICYSVVMEIGGKPFSLLVDTGSPVTWVTPPNGQYSCTKLFDKSDCTVGTNHLSVTSSELSSSNPLGTFSIPYADGSTTQGYYVDRSLKLAPGLTIAHQAIGAATHVEQTLPGDVSWMDGLLGLGPWIEYPSPFFSILSSLKNKMFSLVLYGDADTDSEPANRGLLSFGGYPSSLKITSNWASIPLIWDDLYSHWYTVKADSYIINGKKFGNQGVPLIVDSGTTYTTVPQAVAAELYKLLPGTGSSDWLKECGPNPGTNEKCLIEPNGARVWKVPCDAAMPSFGIVLGGMEFRFQADNLNALNGKMCFSSVRPMRSSDEAGVLGFSFWKNDVVVVHDWTDGKNPRLVMANYEDPEK